LSHECPNDLLVLVFAPFGKDSVLIEKVLQQSGFAVRVCPDAANFLASVGESAGAAIVTEEVLQSEHIGALAEKLSRQPRWSDFPLIVLPAAA